VDVKLTIFYAIPLHGCRVDCLLMHSHLHGCKIDHLFYYKKNIINKEEGNERKGKENKEQA
jgi:hypothetical protein